MPNFSRVLLSTLLLLLLVVLISYIITVPYLRSESDYYLDSRIREEHAGKYNCIILGSSHALTAFDTAIIDNRLSCSSYNISGIKMTLDNRYHLLEKELSRNPIDRVILELSFDSFTRTAEGEYAYGDEPTIARMDNFGERIQYMFRNMPLEDWLNLYSRQVSAGVSYYGDKILGRVDETTDFVNKKGTCFYTANDVSLPQDNIDNLYAHYSAGAPFREDNIEKVDRILSLCKKHNVEVIVVVTPVSDAFLWEWGDMDTFHNNLNDFCDERQLPCFDFNLIKTRYSLFSDDISYKDQNHLSRSGAEIFTNLLCDTIHELPLDDGHPDLFYQSYSELLQSSPYKQYLEQ